MSVELEPAELGFKRPFTHEVSQTLRLSNPTSESIAFKVKTTAPKQYCVRPNSGRIEPSTSVSVQVLLQAMREDPAPEAKCRDKFLVQSVAIPASEADTNVAQIWHHIETTAKSTIQEKKIRVVFLPADGSQANGTASHSEAGDDNPPAYSSPSPSAAAVTPQRTSAQGLVSLPQEKPADAVNRGDAAASAHNPAMSASSGGAMAAVSNAIPTSQDDLRRQLDDAKATISRLQNQASEGLRKRNVGGSGASGEKSGSTAQAVQNASAGGVPVQIVAGLCLLCFLIAYFFF